MYGMNKNMIDKAKYKVKANRAFMSSHGIVLDSKIIPFSDFVANSYINSHRYVAELQHRAWSIYEYAKNRDLTNIFLTLTLPSNFHAQKTVKDKLVFNKKFSGRSYITKITHPLTGEVLKLMNSKENIKKYTPRGASKELSRLLKKLFDDRSYKNITSDNRCYFRVTEPHKSGTPHLHVSLYVPEQNVDALVKAINRLFPSPQSKIELKVDSPVSYLMKYILKTLDDLRNDTDNITALSLWYVYHGISRFYTSRTFVSLEVYRKLKGMYTLNELTESYENESLSIQLCTQTGKVARIDNQHGILYSPKPIMSSFSNHQWRQDMENEDNTYWNYEFEEVKYLPNEPRIVDVDIDGENYILFNGSLKKQKRLPYQMKNYELILYFNGLDPAHCEPAHYIESQNVMIKRGLMVGEFLKPSEYIEVF